MLDLPSISSELLPLSAPSTTGRSTREVCRDFESVLIHMLLKEMENTIPSAGLLDDSSVRQARSMFWMVLADDIADAGGFGLWKDIENAIGSPPPSEETAP